MKLHITIWIFTCVYMELAFCITTDVNTTISRGALPSNTDAGAYEEMQTVAQLPSDGQPRNSEFTLDSNSVISTSNREECRYDRNCENRTETSNRTNLSSSTSPKIMWNLVSTIRSSTKEDSASDDHNDAEIAINSSTIPTIAILHTSLDTISYSLPSQNIPGLNHDTLHLDENELDSEIREVNDSSTYFNTHIATGSRSESSADDLHSAFVYEETVTDVATPDSLVSGSVKQSTDFLTEISSISNPNMSEVHRIQNRATIDVSFDSVIPTNPSSSVHFEMQESVNTLTVTHLPSTDGSENHLEETEREIFERNVTVFPYDDAAITFPSAHWNSKTLSKLQSSSSDHHSDPVPTLETIFPISRNRESLNANASDFTEEFLTLGEDKSVKLSESTAYTTSEVAGVNDHNVSEIRNVTPFYSDQENELVSDTDLDSLNETYITSDETLFPVLLTDVEPIASLTPEGMHHVSVSEVSIDVNATEAKLVTLSPSEGFESYNSNDTAEVSDGLTNITETYVSYHPTDTTNESVGYQETQSFNLNVTTEVLDETVNATERNTETAFEISNNLFTSLLDISLVQANSDEHTENISEITDNRLFSSESDAFQTTDGPSAQNSTPQFLITSASDYEPEFTTYTPVDSSTYLTSTESHYSETGSEFHSSNPAELTTDSEDISYSHDIKPLNFTSDTDTSEPSLFTTEGSHSNKTTEFLTALPISKQSDEIEATTTESISFHTFSHITTHQMMSTYSQEISTQTYKDLVTYPQDGSASTEMKFTSHLPPTETHREGKHIPFSTTVTNTRMSVTTAGRPIYLTTTMVPETESTEKNLIKVFYNQIQAEDLSADEKANVITGIIQLPHHYYSKDEVDQVMVAVHLWLLHAIVEGYENNTMNLSDGANGYLSTSENFPHIIFYVLPTPEVHSTNITLTFIVRNSWKNETLPFDMVLTILKLRSEELRHAVNANSTYFFHGSLERDYNLFSVIIEKYRMTISIICSVTVVMILFLICIVVCYRRKSRQSAHCLTDDKLHRNMQEAMGIDLNPAVVILQDEKAVLNGNKISSVDDDEGWLAPIGDVPVAEDSSAPFVQDTKL